MEEFLEERLIERQLMNYCRAMDRCDAELGRAVFFADAKVDYGAMFVGDGHEFIDFSLLAHQKFETHLHRISNVLIDVKGTGAVSETYVDAQFRLTEGGESFDLYTRGRYLDRWEKRDGSWAIVHRRYVNALAGRRAIAEIPFASEGRRDRSDASYELFSSPN